MKIVKSDFPFKVIIEDKTSKAGNPYQAITLMYYEKNLKATCDADKYKPVFINFFNEQDLLRFASLAENAYQSLKDEREKEYLEKKKLLKGVVKPNLPNNNPNQPFLDDDIPFGA